ncbi:hypothetical protein PTKIN_Ptkin07bG0244700 [Pterospermum kingtungense]
MLNLTRLIFFYILTLSVVAAQLAPPPRADSNRLNYSHLDPSLMIIVLVLVFSFFFVGFLSVYIRRCEEYNASATTAALAAASTTGRTRPKGLDPAVIESFPVFIYSYVKDLKLGKGTLECAVCLSEFEDDETLRLVPKCSHVFHPDCIDAWLAYHDTCPVCRAKLTPDSDPNSNPVDSSSNCITELNSNNNNESSPPATQQVELERNELVIRVNEESQWRAGKIQGKFQRSHSTGHSLIQPGVNVERFTLRLPEEMRKQIAKSGKLKRTRSDINVLGREGCSRKGEEGSSGGKRSYSEPWVFLMALMSPKGGGGGDGDGEGSYSWRGLTSVKGKLSSLNLKVEQLEKQESSADHHQPPV